VNTGQRRAEGPDAWQTACACLSVILLSGCANTIYPPEELADIRQAYLVDLGHHSRLALELPDGSLLEYGYGEWQWYARMEHQWWRVPAVLFWPTQGALGRRKWPAPHAQARLLDEYDGLIVLELSADARRADALIAQLGREFNRHPEQQVRNDIYRLDFVPSPRPYWLFNNSNHAVKKWLQALGYEVTGSGIFAEWKYEE
jgi:hypothetical protein